MEKFVIWYVLSFKENLKKRGAWMATFGMLFLVWVVSNISVPNYENMKIGIWFPDSIYLSSVKAELLKSNQSLRFTEYENQQILTDDVINGVIDCGFVFCEDFDEKFESKNIDDSILCIATPFSSKSDVAKEKIYAAFFRRYSEKILNDLEHEIFQKKDKNRMLRIKEINQKYQEGTDVFQLQIQEIDQSFKKQENSSKNNVIRGLIGLFLFLTMFLSYGTTRLKEGDNVEAALNKKECILYRYLKMMAAVSLPSIFGIFTLLNYTQSTGMIQEISRLLLFLLVSAVWISVVGLALGRAEHMPLWIFTLLLLHLLVCPVFYDISQYVPAMKWIRKLLPLTMYLVG